jgi:MFS family permease
VDAASYVVSAANLLLIRTPEAQPSTAETTTGVLRAVTEGFGMLWAHHSLRALACVAGIYNLFGQWIAVLFILFAVDELGLSSATIGVVLSSAAVGAFVGSLLAGHAARGLGVGPALVWAVVVECSVMVPIGFVAGPQVVVLVLLVGIYVINGCFVTMSSVHALAYRQAVTPEPLLGRVTSAYRFISYGAIPLGALFGGLAGEWLGARGGLVLGSISLLTAVGAVLRSPLRHVRELPAMPEIGAP